MALPQPMCSEEYPSDHPARPPSSEDSPILVCHNYYQQRGGEDQSFEAELELLRSRGHEVVRYTLHNDAIDAMSRWDVAGRTVWNHRTYRDVRALIRQTRPRIMHCTNTFPLMSPAVLYAARHEGVPVIQSIRNYRLGCLNGLFLRNGRVCEDCVGKTIPWPGVAHACYRNSRAASAVVAGALSAHRALRTWIKAVDLYVTLTDFARGKLTELGLPAERIVVKPNFVDPDPGVGAGGGGYAVFAGRLSSEKGIETLLAAWSHEPVPLPLKIVGDGPLRVRVEEIVSRHEGIELLGPRPLPDVLDVIGDATVLVMPSECYETFGRTIVEAFAKGTPVVASQMGAMAELIDHGRTGLHFAPGNSADLARRIRELVTGFRQTGLRRAAREEYERRYTGTINYQMLAGIYGRALSMTRPLRRRDYKVA